MSGYTKDQAYYGNGYQKSISETHSWRTAENSCAYMLSFIKSTDVILDVGCGPGSISCDLAKHVPNGKVVGIEPTEQLIKEANNHKYSNGVKNAEFKIASAYSLPFEDNSFDIVHCHQVLIHLEDPETAFKEMVRVLKPTGYVCSREADLRATSVYPPKYEDTIVEYFLLKTKNSSTSDNRGRSLRDLALSAGIKLRHIHSTVSTWCISNDDDRKWFSEMFIKRMKEAKEVLVKEDEEANTRKREEIIDSWNEFIDDVRGWLLFVHGEVICQKEF